jgi:saccharopine dehydrogenase-like NADP-dependent oxidoreductase
MRILVIGAGYVGLSNAVLLAQNNSLLSPSNAKFRGPRKNLFSA